MIVKPRTPGSPDSDVPRASWKNAAKLWTDYLWREPAFPTLDRFLSVELKKNPTFGKRDRAWYSQVLFQGARFALTELYAEWMRRGHSRKEFLRIVADPQSVRRALQMMDGEVFLKQTLARAEEPDCFDSFDPEKDPLLWEGLSPLLESFLSERKERSGWTEEMVSTFISRHSTRPPLWIRMNHPERRKEVIRELKANEFKVERHEQFENSYAIEGFKSVFEFESYRSGAFEIQDLASQMIGYSAAGLHPGQFAWDACAGAGGKTLQLASFIGNKGAVYASDIRDYILNDNRKRVKRAGFANNVRFFEWDGKAPPELQKEVAIRNGFDWVLVDAPCSSSGTWRRNPDGKLRFSRANAKEFQKLQLQILSAAAPAVRPGGNLVYGTCSFFVDENEKVVELFQERVPGFRLESMVLHGSPLENADTTFSAILKKE